MFKRKQKLLALFILIFLGTLLMSKESYAAPTVRIVVNPDKTEISVGSDKIVLTALAIGRNLQFKWELVGPGELKGDTTKSAIFYIPPDRIDGESGPAIVTLKVIDDSGEDATESIIFTIVGSDTLLKYNFEDDSNGWIPQEDYKGTQACVQVKQSDEKSREGNYSLEMFMDLVGGDTQKSRGEAWVNMLQDPPNDGELAPIDLTNRTVSTWVYAPKSSLGDESKPNGFQLFVKDKNWNSKYGTWYNVVENRWVKISLTVNTSQLTSGEWVAPGFDPSQIIVVGLKMGSSRNSTARYKGPIYVDAINW